MTLISDFQLKLKRKITLSNKTEAEINALILINAIVERNIFDGLCDYSDNEYTHDTTINPEVVLEALEEDEKRGIKLSDDQNLAKEFLTALIEITEGEYIMLNIEPKTM